MLARNTEDLEKRLQMQLEELEPSHKDSKTKTEASEESEWSREGDGRYSDSHGSQHLTVPDVPDSPTADDEQTSKSTEMRATKPDNKDV